MNPSGKNSPLFQILGRPTAVHVPVINQGPLQLLISILDRPLADTGLCSLLRAPRAGYGKSHLLCQAQDALRRTHEFIPLQSIDGSRFDASSSLENVITQLTQVLPGGSGITPLDLLARKFFAVGLEPLVRSGEVPCQNRDSALLALSQRPLETFDFHHPSAVTAHWTRNHFEVLSPRLTTEISQLLQLPLREASFWTDALFHYASAPTADPARVSQLMQAVLRFELQNPHDRLSSLLHLMSQWQRVVIVVDELEGLSANPEAALRLATFLTTIRHGAERIDVILSLNHDIWENAFLPKLSAGLLDRLTEASISLSPLNEQEALALLQSRYPHATAQDLAQLAITGDLYARGLLRAAAAQPPSPAAPTAAPANVPSIALVPASPIAPAAPSLVAQPVTSFVPPAAPTVPLLPPTAEIVPAAPSHFATPAPAPAPSPAVPVATPVSEPTAATSAWWTVPATQVANPFAPPATAAPAANPSSVPSTAIESPFEIESKEPDPVTFFQSIAAQQAAPLFAPPAPATEPVATPTFAQPTPSPAPQNADPVESLLRDLRQRYGNPS